MGLLSLKRDFQDLARLRRIITILVEHGFHHHLAKANLAKHARISARVIAPRHETTPERVRETLEALGPTFVKLGQILSLRPDLVPLEYCEEFRKLQDEVAPLPFAVVKGVVEAELKRPLKAVFKEFNPEPLAAASIGQVHRATLLDGKHVVVKVQRPGVAETMARDIDIMEYLAAKLDKYHPGFSATGIVAEFKEYTVRELDFSFELRNVKKFHAFFAQDRHVVIPDAYGEFSTKHILVLDYVKGIRVSDKDALVRAHVDQKALAKIGFDAMFRQVFELGIFHADPHPGNLLAVKRGDGYALALLDFGIVGFLDDRIQQLLLDNLSAIVGRDARGVVKVLLKLGDRQAGFDERQLEHTIATAIMDWHGTTFNECNMSALLYKIFAESANLHLCIPPDIILCAKAFVTIEGAGAWLDPTLNITEEAMPLLQRQIRRRYSPARLRSEALAAAGEFRELARDIPAAADTLIAKIKEGKVEFQIDKDEFARAERTYDLETTKKSLSLIPAAFFVGSGVIVGLAPELAFVGWPLYLWGFSLFLITLVLLIRFSIKTHKYLERFG